MERKVAATAAILIFFLFLGFAFSGGQQYDIPKKVHRQDIYAARKVHCRLQAQRTKANKPAIAFYKLPEIADKLSKHITLIPLQEIHSHAADGDS